MHFRAKFSLVLKCVQSIGGTAAPSPFLESVTKPSTNFCLASCAFINSSVPAFLVKYINAVSYTHLTLPTNREV